MNMALQLEAIRQAADRVAASLHLEVVDLDFSGGMKFRTLRIFIEKDAAERERLRTQTPSEASKASSEEDAEDAEIEEVAEHLSGVTHEDCAAFSHDLGTLLDVEELIPGAEYTLEVSSPGLDRKLRTPAEFERFSGSSVKLQTFTAVNGNRHYAGRIASVAGGKLTLDISAAKPKGKAAKAAAKVAAVQTVELDLANIEKANLVPEI
jgi:ribosome maturation factor RimP